ncbi:MAG: hypothetical protein JNK27_12400 [Chitinophagaceae bacterium]|nr:hypothetical protein [Chitinophagaceae bacterium]
MQIPKYLLIFSFATFLVACNDTATKADSDDIPAEKKEVDNANTIAAPPTAGTDATIATLPDSSKSATESNKILANIDQYLLSSAVIPESTSNADGFHGAAVKIENTLKKNSFQKIMVEVSILLADDKEYRTDYYTLYNIEPGSIKTIKIPNTSRGSKIVSHIVKVKSDELTKGEWVLTGSKFVPR